MGGKNVYYFLTELARGRLQVLPVAYDVHKRAWYDTAASGVRHFPDRRDEALDWTDRLFTFNQNCFNCHVSELATRYDLATDTYHTTWAEPGISCESCHGPGGEHVRVMDGSPPQGHSSRDIRLIRTKEFTAEQMNDLCAACHAKMVPLSTGFRPGDKFFDHFDLATLEDPDYYPDGRDLGENYTFTSWSMSPCARSGKLDCNHCHTPSGRPRFEGEQSNQLCMPCHAKHVSGPAAHGRHKPGSQGNQCVACHMPMTRFAGMRRSDHSMRPPTPAATTAFQSPNACNLCHADHDAAWADGYVRKWYPRDYQAEVLRQATLLDAARKQQWRRLPEILAELKKRNAEPVYKASLTRLVRECEDEAKWPVLLGLLGDPSPLVRSSAVSAFAGHVTPDAIGPLLAATSDSSRLVRIRAAMALASLRPELVRSSRERESLEKAVEEFTAAMRARPDDWASHANLGNFAMEREEFQAAVQEFEISHKLDPRMVGPMVNAAIAYSNLGQRDKAEASLRRALKADPANAAALFNLGLLLGEMRRVQEADQALRAALKADPQMAAAAYNLGVLSAERDLGDAIRWCRKAHNLRPDDPKYAHTLAFYQHKKGDTQSAVRLLREVVRRHPLELDCYLLLGEIYESQNNAKAAAEVYRDALTKEGWPTSAQDQLQAKLRSVEGRR
jgi:tetratricopeptide (TPR) repeat protein